MVNGVLEITRYINKLLPFNVAGKLGILSVFKSTIGEVCLRADGIAFMMGNI